MKKWPDKIHRKFLQLMRSPARKNYSRRELRILARKFKNGEKDF